MNNFRSNARAVMNMPTFSETSLKNQTRRRTMEKDGNNPEKEEPQPRKKVQGTKRQTLHSRRSKETI
jgi:hypothetical protein